MKEVNFTNQVSDYDEALTECEYASHMKRRDCLWVVLNRGEWQYTHYEHTAKEIANKLGCEHAPISGWITYLQEASIDRHYI